MKAPIDTIKNDGFAIMAGMIFFHTDSIGQKQNIFSGSLVQLPNGEVEKRREADPKNIWQQQISGVLGYPIKTENIKSDSQPQERYSYYPEIWGPHAEKKKRPGGVQKYLDRKNGQSAVNGLLVPLPPGPNHPAGNGYKQI
jgi:hypothetical protein